MAAKGIVTRFFVDVAIMLFGPLSVGLLSEIQEDLEESNISPTPCGDNRFVRSTLQNPNNSGILDLSIIAFIYVYNQVVIEFFLITINL